MTLNHSIYSHKTFSFFPLSLSANPLDVFPAGQPSIWARRLAWWAWVRLRPGHWQLRTFESLVSEYLICEHITHFHFIQIPFQRYTKDLVKATLILKHGSRFTFSLQLDDGISTWKVTILLLFSCLLYPFSPVSNCWRLSILHVSCFKTARSLWANLFMEKCTRRLEGNTWWSYQNHDDRSLRKHQLHDAILPEWWRP